MRRAELLKNSAEDVLRGHRPTRMEIKCSNMQHETLSNDLAPWHVSRCLRYGSSRERFFLSRLEKIRKRFVVADEKEKKEMKGERAPHERGSETENEWRAYCGERNIHLESTSRSARPSADWRWMKTRPARHKRERKKIVAEAKLNESHDNGTGRL